MSAVMASRFFAVSFSVSPLVMDEAEEAIEITFAPSLWAAISNDVRVRVLGSRKRFTMVRPP